MKYVNSITARSKHMSVTAHKGKECRSITLDVTELPISYDDALDLDKEFSELMDFTLNVQL